LCIGVGNTTENIVYEEVVLENIWGEVLGVAALLVVLVPMLDLRQGSVNKKVTKL
jgi:hypothetical protein